MDLIVETIQKHLRHAHAIHVNIKVGCSSSEKQALSAVDFILDIAGLAEGIPESILIQNVKNLHGVNGSDRVLVYPIERFDHALEILKQFCLVYNYALTAEDINSLRRNLNYANRFMIFIIERPYLR